jgi:hypothetical protein
VDVLAAAYGFGAGIGDGIGYGEEEEQEQRSHHACEWEAEGETRWLCCFSALLGEVLRESNGADNDRFFDLDVEILP